MERFNISTPQAMNLLRRQLVEWPMAAANFEALRHVETAETDACGVRFTLQFNPARMASTGAKIDRKTLAARPCFLCGQNRPTEQMHLDIGQGYLLLVNPYPIFPVHFTIPAAEHTPQRITANNCLRFGHMAQLALQLPEMAVFYNGPRCGASAPDHMHFQVVERNRLPIFSWLTSGAPLPFQAFTCTFANAEAATAWFRDLMPRLPVPDAEPPHEETPVNVLCSAVTDADGKATAVQVIVIPRKAHRPDFYGTGANEILVSPASVDLSGVVILPSADDFHHKFTPDRLASLLAQTCYPSEYPHAEPVISVGVMSAPSINFKLPGHEVQTAHPDITGRQVVCGDATAQELTFAPNAPFELTDVPIGINFHWQRTESQRFGGRLRIIAEPGTKKVIAINDIGLEEYLKSVISSEMSANASDALLRAHAIVSRSWLLKQLHDVGKHPCGRSSATFTTTVDGQPMQELCCWHDREDHTLFDVCADDHCQRYQGLTRQTSPAVEAAVEATRGMVLTYGGEICDARFSKCCGGRSETFGNCWEDEPHPYLEPVDDPYCNTTDTAILDQVLNSYDRESLDFHHWKATYSPAELSDLVRRRSGIDFGDILELQPLTRGASGRIVRLLIKGSLCSMIVGKELEIRRWLSESHLRSSNFEVTRDSDGNFVLRGLGWGHGVGMCQIGAAVMGAKGFSAEAILNHYFPKATLTKIY